MDKLHLKKARYERRKLRVKRKIKAGNISKLRLCISRSNRGFYAQIIDDVKGHTLVAASTYEKDFPQMKVKGNRRRQPRWVRFLRKSCFTKY